MTQRIILSLLLCFSFLTGKAQDMASVFTNMPDQYIPLLENAWRKDLVDLINAGKEARLENMMGGNSVLQKLTNNYLLLQTSERSTLEMKLLPLINNSKIVCVVTTVFGPAPNSIIAFYTTDWQPLSAENIFTPVTPDWFLKADADKMSNSYLDAVSALDMDLIHYQLNADQETLSATYTTPLYLSKEERAKVTPFLKAEPKMYTWNQSRFN